MSRRSDAACVAAGFFAALANSLIYATSCTRAGRPGRRRGSALRPWVHDANDWPVLLAGKAGGALKGSQHVRNQGENLSRVLFSTAGLMGAPVTSIGAAEGLVSTGVAGLT